MTFGNVENFQQLTVRRRSAAYSLRFRWGGWCAFEVTMKRHGQHTMGMLRAYKAGYRISDAGELVAPRGQEHLVGKSGGNIYLYTSIRGVSKDSFLLHRLAAYQKFGEKMFDDGIEVRHLNGVKTDNSLNNISIGTHRQNILDIPLKKRREVSRIASMRMITPDEIVARIGDDRKSGLSYKELAAKYNLKYKCVDNILQKYKLS